MLFRSHGHVWARDPYVPEDPGCLTAGTLGDGTPLAAGGSDCGLSSVKIGHNPLAWYLGGQESWTPQAHFDIVLPSAGGLAEVKGDYLVRDHASFGVTDGLWGIMRVAEADAPGCAGNQAPTAEITGPNGGSRQQTLTWDGTTSTTGTSGDEAGQTLTYAWTLTDPNGRVRASGSNDTFKVRIGKNWKTGTYTVTLIVTDSCNVSSAPAEYAVNIN